MQIVSFGYHAYEFIGQNKCDDQSGDRDDDVITKVAHHIKDARIPALGSLSHLSCDRASLLIYVGKHAGKISGDEVCKQVTDPILQIF